MGTRFKKKSQLIDIGITAVAAVLSVGIMIYGISHLGLRDTWPELVLNLCYIACLVMMGLYFFKRLDSQRFNYWSSVCIGITVLLRDILFAPPLENYPIHLICLTLSVLRNLWMLFIIDMFIAGLYHYVISFNPVSEYTTYLLTEIWIRPTLIYGLVACFVSEREPDMGEA